MRTNRTNADVIVLADSGPGRLRRLRAALHLAHPDAVVTGREALWLNGVSVPPRGAVHLVVPVERPSRADGSVIVEHSTRMPDPLWRRGIPTAPVARATVDACRRMSVAEEVRALIRTTEDHVPIGDLHGELARAPARGTMTLRRVLADIDRGLRADSARAAADLIALAGLPPPRWTARLSTVADVHLAVVDAWWDDIGLAWDCDLHQPWNPRPETRALTRAARLTAVGIVPVHTDPARVLLEPRAVAGELRGAYQLATARPRPRVVMS
ncbi:hypothetical protein [Actinokineospora inagensis]|uniref:hypothetical protein n=1 Tax=Actinokineospora inagensis TaxID=103730 RepID=UPI0012FAF7EA|nr:hypothetical protein [Actinokineospora inagensis]